MDQRQFPRQVRRVLDARVHALTARRAVDVRRVTAQKDPLLAEPGGDLVLDAEMGRPGDVLDV